VVDVAPGAPVDLGDQQCTCDPDGCGYEDGECLVCVTLDHSVPCPVAAPPHPAWLADLAARPGGHHVGEVPPGDRVHPAAVGDGSPGAHPEEPTDPVDEVDDLTTRARRLLAASNGRPPGRRALARELGITEHRARTVLDLVGATGPSNGIGTPTGGDLR